MAQRGYSAAQMILPVFGEVLRRATGRTVEVVAQGPDRTRRYRWPDLVVAPFKPRSLIPFPGVEQAATMLWNFDMGWKFEPRDYVDGVGIFDDEYVAGMGVYIRMRPGWETRLSRTADGTVAKTKIIMLQAALDRDALIPRRHG